MGISKNEIGLKHCALCPVLLSEDNHTKEHIIPNAIGGRRKVSGFICRPCNSKSGDEWDAALAEVMAPLCLLLDIKRERGETPDQIFETVGGPSIRINNDGTMTLAKPSRTITEKDGQITINAQVRTIQEARQLLEGLKRTYPQIDVDALMKQFEVKPSYSNNPIKMQFSFGGPEAGRAMVKSALALAVDNGVDPSLCETAIGYLKNQDAVPCFGFYYEKDLISNRPSDRVFHCVAISGDSKTGLLLGYIEYFSAQRVVLCLSESYSGPDVHACYAIDPVTGQEVDLQFNLPFSKEDMESIYRYEKIPDGAMADAMKLPLTIARRMEFERAKNRAIEYAVDSAFKECVNADGVIETPEEKWKFSRMLAEKMMPFIMQNINRRPNRGLPPVADQKE